MKKLFVLGAVVGLVFAVGSANAISLGSITKNSAVNKLGSDIQLKVMNDDIKKKIGSCKCDVKSGTIKGCNLSKVRSSIDNNKIAVKAAFSRSFRIRSRVNRACWNDLQAKIPASNGYWSWYYSKWEGTDVKIWGTK